MKLDRAQTMHRRAQKAEGRVSAALYELDLCEQFFTGKPNDFLVRATIRNVRRALVRRSTGHTK